MILLTEVKLIGRKSVSSPSNEFLVQDVVINPNQITLCRPDDKMGFLFEDGDQKIPGHAGTVEFTKIFLDRGNGGIDITVVGCLREISEKLKKSENEKDHEVLHG